MSSENLEDDMESSPPSISEKSSGRLDEEIRKLQLQEHSDAKLLCKNMNELQCAEAKGACLTIKNKATGKFASCRSKGKRTRKLNSLPDENIREKLSKIQDELERLTRLRVLENTKKEREEDKLRRTMREGEDIIHKLKREKREAELEKQRIENELRELKEQAKKSSSSKTITPSSSSSSSGRVTFNLIKEKTELKEKIDELEEENQQLQEDYANAQKDATDFKNRNIEKTVKFDEEKMKIMHHFHERKSEIEAELDKLKSENKDLEKDYDNAVDEHDKEMAKTEKILKEIKKKEADKTAENKELMKQIEHLKKKIKEQNQKNFDTKKEIDSNSDINKKFLHKIKLEEKGLALKEKMALKLFKRAEEKKLDKERKEKARIYAEQKREYKKIHGVSAESSSKSEDHDETEPVLFSDSSADDKLPDGWTVLKDYAGNETYVNIDEGVAQKDKPDPEPESSIYNISEKEKSNYYDKVNGKRIFEGWIQKLDKNNEPYYKFTGWEYVRDADGDLETDINGLPTYNKVPNSGRVNPLLKNIQYEFPVGIPQADVSSSLSNSGEYKNPKKTVRYGFFGKKEVDMSTSNIEHILPQKWKLKKDKHGRKYYKYEYSQNTDKTRKNKQWMMPVRSPIKLNSLKRKLPSKDKPVFTATNAKYLEDIQEKLPKGWTAHRDINNNVYFYGEYKNRAGKVIEILSQWTRPTVPIMKIPSEGEYVADKREAYFADDDVKHRAYLSLKHRKMKESLKKNWSVAIDPTGRNYYYYKGEYNNTNPFDVEPLSQHKFSGQEGMHYRYKNPLQDYIGKPIISNDKKYYHFENTPKSPYSVAEKTGEVDSRGDAVMDIKIDDGKAYYRMDKTPPKINRNATRKFNKNTYYNFLNKEEGKKRIRQWNKPERSSPVSFSNKAPVKGQYTAPEEISPEGYRIGKYLNKLTRKIKTGRFNLKTRKELNQEKKDEPLPAGWKMRIDEKNRAYYVGKKNGKVVKQWNKPISDATIYKKGKEVELDEIASNKYEFIPKVNLRIDIEARKRRRLLKPGWSLEINPLTNEKYYYNAELKQVKKQNEVDDIVITDTDEISERKKELIGVKVKSPKLVSSSEPLPEGWVFVNVKGINRYSFYYNERKGLSLDTHPNNIPDAQFKHMEPQPIAWMKKFDIKKQKYIYQNLINGHVVDKPLRIIPEETLREMRRQWEQFISPIDGLPYWYSDIKGITISIDPMEYMLYEDFYKPIKKLPFGWMEKMDNQGTYYENVETGDIEGSYANVNQHYGRRPMHNSRNSPPRHYQKQQKQRHNSPPRGENRAVVVGLPGDNPNNGQNLQASAPNQPHSPVYQPHSPVYQPRSPASPPPPQLNVPTGFAAFMPKKYNYDARPGETNGIPIIGTANILPPNWTFDRQLDVFRNSNGQEISYEDATRDYLDDRNDVADGHPDSLSPGWDRILINFEAEKIFAYKKQNSEKITMMRPE